MTSSPKLQAIWPGEKKFVNLTWQVSDVCNFKCSYCNPGNWGGSHRNLDVDRYIEVFDQIITHFQDRGYEVFKVFFSGGEPTIWPPLLPICDFVKSKVKQPLLAVNTNFSRPLSWWEKNYLYFRDVVASFHVEHTNKERYLENAKFLQYHMPYLAFRMLMHDERFQEVVEFADRLKRELDNYVIEYAPLFEELGPHAGMHEYKDEWKRDFLRENHLFSKRTASIENPNEHVPAYCVEHYSGSTTRELNSNRIVAEGKNNFKGWQCWVNDSIFIGPNGNIRLASCNASQIVGNIHEGRVRFLEQPVTCPELRCNCGTDINIPKAAPEWLRQNTELSLTQGASF